MYLTYMKLSFLIREMEKIMSIRIKEINILKALIIAHIIP